MQLKLNNFLLLIVGLFFLSACQSTDPFKSEIDNSSIELATYYAKAFLSKGEEDSFRDIYEYLSTVSRDEWYMTPFEAATKGWVKERTEAFDKYEITPWEKIDLKDNTSLVYLLVNYDYRKLRRKYKKFSIFRVYLVMEDGWKIEIPSPDTENKIFYQVAGGDKDDLSDDEVKSLREEIRDDARSFEFQKDLKNQATPQENMVEQCLGEGEKLYDQEEYRKALMQFQKALSIDPENEKAKVYIRRCKKAIKHGLQS